VTELERYRHIQGLQAAVYQQADPTADPARLKQLIDAVKSLPPPEPPPGPPRSRGGRMLGPDTTGLSVETTLRHQELPTAIYPLLNPETDPLLEVRVQNASSRKRRVRVTACLEGLSAQAIKTLEIPPGDTETVKLAPSLFPAQARELTQVQWATLHVVAQDLDGAEERHDTFPLLCLARDSGFNYAARTPKTGAIEDLTHYYGAWVTPYVEPVQELVRAAADLAPGRWLTGYQPSGNATPEADVDAQVEALFNALKQVGIAYVHSIVSYGAPAGVLMQRTRLPRESLARKSANCLDAVVLMASLIEGASLNPALVFVPGHAFVGWQLAPEVGGWHYLEATMIRDAAFADARRSGEEQYAQWSAVRPVTRHSLIELRARKIWPME